MRASGRAFDQLREISLEPGFAPQAEGSCLIRCGNTHVLCTASVQERVPPFLRNSGRGWVTAEYGMLPRSTDRRTDREAARGRQSGRTQEIQRLIGRALRAVTEMTLMGERQIVLDCDVLRADGGPRTAAITGANVALHQALAGLVEAGELPALPLREPLAAVSCGLVAGTALLDLDYQEDSSAEADANFVLTASGAIVEIQVTAESAPLPPAQFAALHRLAEQGVGELLRRQRQALGLEG
jgi:ribonuclease PH